MTDFQKLTYKTTVIKAGSVLIGFASVCITLGIYLGDWQAWRKSTTDDVNTLKVWKETFISQKATSKK